MEGRIHTSAVFSFRSWRHSSVFTASCSERTVSCCFARDCSCWNRDSSSWKGEDLTSTSDKRDSRSLTWLERAEIWKPIEAKWERRNRWTERIERIENIGSKEGEAWGTNESIQRQPDLFLIHFSISMQLINFMLLLFFHRNELLLLVLQRVKGRKSVLVVLNISFQLVQFFKQTWICCFQRVVFAFKLLIL